MGSLTATIVKNLNFKNLRCLTAAILKTGKLPYLCNLLTDFDEIWHNDAYWPAAPEVKFDFLKFSTILRGAEPLS